MPSQSLVLYDLVAVVNAGNPLFSPHTIKARLSLVHKGVPFETKELSFRDIRTTLADKLDVRASGAFSRLGNRCAVGGALTLMLMLLSRAWIIGTLVPVLEFEDGSLLQDSLAIAHYLEKTYPNAPSIFLPESSTPVDLTSAEYLVAVEFQVKWSKTFGTVEGSFPPFFGLAAPYIQQHMDCLPSEDCDANYFMSDAKMGFPNAWPTITKVAEDQDTLMKNARTVIKTLEDILQTQSFVASATRPGFADFATFGWYSMLSKVRPACAQELWMQGKIGEWVKRMIKEYKLEDFEAKKW
ncbi:hypothetical protein P7C70_g6798, partial [Phenoliferia sp. Uapishka_3]